MLWRDHHQTRDGSESLISRFFLRESKQESLDRCVKSCQCRECTRSRCRTKRVRCRSISTTFLGNAVLQGFWHFKLLTSYVTTLPYEALPFCRFSPLKGREEGAKCQSFVCLEKTTQNILLTAYKLFRFLVFLGESWGPDRSSFRFACLKQRQVIHPKVDFFFFEKR